MIRDLDESGARPLRGPGDFRRPPVDADALAQFARYFGEARQRMVNAEAVFYGGEPRAGLRLIWDCLERVESLDVALQAYVTAYLLPILASYGPVGRSIRFARRSLRFLPARGEHTKMRAVVLGELAHLYLRQADRAGVRRCCREILRLAAADDIEGAIGAARLRQSQLLQLEGEVAEALAEAEEAAKLTREGKLGWLPKPRYVALHLAQIREANGLRQEAHEAYRWTTEIIHDLSFATKAEHQAAWDGYHRTRPAPPAPSF